MMGVLQIWLQIYCTYAVCMICLLLSAHRKASDCKTSESDAELSVMNPIEECKQIKLFLEKLSLVFITSCMLKL